MKQSEQIKQIQEIKRMSKLIDLEARRIRLEKEIEKSQKEINKKLDMLKKKKALLAQINSEIVSQLLVDNQMTMTDLTALLSSDKVNQQLSNIAARKEN
jgi:plasmid rolling circle replication initiator protein Rep